MAPEVAARPKPFRIRRMRTFAVSFLFAAGVVNYLDRAALSIAAPLIQKDLNFTHAQMGVVFSSFFIGYALFNFVGGVLSDKIGAKKVFGGAMGIWMIRYAVAMSPPSPSNRCFKVSSSCSTTPSEKKSERASCGLPMICSGHQ